MTQTDKPVNIYTDGASRGNPGDAAWGYLILDADEDLITRQAGYIGRSTNNQAEYFAVIRSLQRAGDITGGKVHLHSDSQLLVKQVTGQWKVKDSELNRLYRRVRSLVEEFSTVRFSHVPRETQLLSKADQLCNDRLDEIQDY